MKLLFSFLLSLLLLQVQAQTPTIIQFGLDKSTLTASSKEQLTNFVQENQTRASAKIELHGYCDSSGPSTYNDRLSLRRVEVIHQFLLSEGIADSAIIVKKGYGENKPLNDNATKEQRSLNRRVELIVPANTEGNTLTVNQILSGAKISSGDKIALKNINFIGGHHYFINESIASLNELLNVMQSHPTMVIRVEGHICCGPADEIDGIDLETGLENLSISRSMAVQQFLINKGIEAQRISHAGFGHSRPIYSYPEKNKEEEQANRRVEIVITAL